MPPVIFFKPDYFYFEDILPEYKMYIRRFSMTIATDTMAVRCD